MEREEAAVTGDGRCLGTSAFIRYPAFIWDLAFNRSFTVFLMVFTHIWLFNCDVMFTFTYRPV